MSTFLGSLDVELLAAHGALAEAHTAYVGFEQLGFAPAYEAAVAAGELQAVETTEYLFVTGLRAAVAGLPYLPTRAAAGSDVLGELGYAEVTCPYTGQPLIAVPALNLDVAVIHAEAADARGNVMGPAAKAFLYDLDANLARAATTVIVTVERLATDAELRAARHRTLLFAHEVDAVVVTPRGAAPTALPGSYDADLEAVRRYLAAAPGARPEAITQLVAG